MDECILTKAIAARRWRLAIVGGKYRSRCCACRRVPGCGRRPIACARRCSTGSGRTHGLACLDLFAGSGALGFEAASRGAARVVMVEKDRVALAELERSLAALGAAQVPSSRRRARLLSEHGELRRGFPRPAVQAE
jgi:16S rRNA (guanine966-N2)-methyltransferase